MGVLSDVDTDDGYSDDDGDENHNFSIAGNQTDIDKHYHYLNW